MSEVPSIDELHAEQERRWLGGDRALVESILESYPRLGDDPDTLLDLIYHEFLLRERLGEWPTLEEYLARFPGCGAELQRQIDFHRVIQEDELDDSSDHEDETPEPRTLGRYLLRRTLGRGGMGVVHEAWDTALGRTIALKTVHFGADDDETTRARFRREAKVAAAFDHPNLCPLYDVGRIDGVTYFTMPLLRGETLAQRIERDGALEWSDVVHLGVTLARALQVAHDAAVIHRDVKPSNVMLVGERPVIIDFGLAAADHVSATKLTSSLSVLGTPAYLAPEQISTSRKPLGATADVYSLAILLFECLVGTPPFTGTIYEVIHAKLHGEAPNVRSLRADVPVRLDRVLTRAMRRSPDERFPDMESFGEALSEVEGDDVSGWFAKPRRRVYWIAGIALSFLIAASALLAWWPREDEGRDRASVTRVAADVLSEGSLWHGSFAFRPPHDLTGDVDLRITRRSGSTFEAIYMTEQKQYEWEVAGSIEGGTIRWHFTRGIRDNPNATLVDAAFVEGRLHQEELVVVFRMPSQGSVADMTLSRVP